MEPGRSDCSSHTRWIKLWLCSSGGRGTLCSVDRHGHRGVGANPSGAVRNIWSILRPPLLRPSHSYRLRTHRARQPHQPPPTPRPARCRSWRAHPARSPLSTGSACTATTLRMKRPLSPRPPAAESGPDSFASIRIQCTVAYYYRYSMNIQAPKCIAGREYCNTNRKGWHSCPVSAYGTSVASRQASYTFSL